MRALLVAAAIVVAVSGENASVFGVRIHSTFYSSIMSNAN